MDFAKDDLGDSEAVVWADFVSFFSVFPLNGWVLI